MTMNKLLLATYSLEHVLTYRPWAEQMGYGLELHNFVNPAQLTDLPQQLIAYKQALRDFAGPVGLHGAFYDMVSASVDPAIVKLTRHRYQQSLEIAGELGASYVVFHMNYMGGFKLANYRAGWHQRQVDFWGEFIQMSAHFGITVLLENMWADDPCLAKDILAEVNHPQLRACFDVAHAALFSPTPLDVWFTTLAPYIHCLHVNNHDGSLDLHWPLNRGTIDYKAVLQQVAQLPRPVHLTLEMPDRQHIETSLDFLHKSAPHVFT